MKTLSGLEMDDRHFSFWCWIGSHWWMKNPLLTMGEASEKYKGKVKENYCSRCGAMK
jgi:hypothetical protein